MQGVQAATVTTILVAAPSLPGPQWTDSSASVCTRGSGHAPGTWFNVSSTSSMTAKTGARVTARLGPAATMGAETVADTKISTKTLKTTHYF